MTRPAQRSLKLAATIWGLSLRLILASTGAVTAMISASSLAARSMRRRIIGSVSRPSRNTSVSTGQPRPAARSQCAPLRPETGLSGDGACVHAVRAGLDRWIADTGDLPHYFPSASLSTGLPSKFIDLGNVMRRPCPAQLPAHLDSNVVVTKKMSQRNNFDFHKV